MSRVVSYKVTYMRSLNVVYNFEQLLIFSLLIFSRKTELIVTRQIGIASSGPFISIEQTKFGIETPGRQFPGTNYELDVN